MNHVSFLFLTVLGWPSSMNGRTCPAIVPVYCNWPLERTLVCLEFSERIAGASRILDDTACMRRSKVFQNAVHLILRWRSLLDFFTTFVSMILIPLLLRCPSSFPAMLFSAPGYAYRARIRFAQACFASHDRSPGPQLHAIRQWHLPASTACTHESRLGSWEHGRA